MKYARLTLSLLAAGLLAACSSAPSTDGQGAAVEDRSSANASGVGGSGVTTVNADGRIRQRLSIPAGDVREPAWGPYIK